MSHDLPDLLETPAKARSVWFRIICLAGAGAFLVLGTIGWLLPIVTGIPFYVVALILLGIGSERCRQYINRMERRLPRALRLKLRHLHARFAGPSRRRSSQAE